MNTKLPQKKSFLCESEREKVYDDRGDTLSVGKSKSRSTIIFMLLHPATGIVSREISTHLNFLSIATAKARPIHGIYLDSPMVVA